jgi:putative transposase
MLCCSTWREQAPGVSAAVGGDYRQPKRQGHPGIERRIRFDKGKLIQGRKRHRILEVVRKQKGAGFHLLPRRWVVERRFAWFSRARRLSKHYERDPNSSKAQVDSASIRLLLRGLCDKRIAYAA